MPTTLSRRSLVCGGLAVVGGAFAARNAAAADEKEKAEKPAAKAAPGGLTIDSLGEMLKAMGLKPNKVESRFDFDFAAKHTEEWNLSMSAVLSTDEKSIWVMAWLDELPHSAADVPRTALLRLLADNDKLGKGQFFAYVPSVRKFVLQRVIDNERVTTAVFKAAILDLGATVVETHGHWSVTEWKQLGQASGSAKEAKEVSGDDVKAGAGAKSAAGATTTTTTRTAVKTPATGETTKTATGEAKALKK